MKRRRCPMRRNKGRAKGRVEGHAEGLEEGLAKGAFNKTVEALRNIVDILNLSLDQAMAMLKVPDADRPKYKEILQPQ